MMMYAMVENKIQSTLEPHTHTYNNDVDADVVIPSSRTHAYPFSRYVYVYTT